MADSPVIAFDDSTAYLVIGLLLTWIVMQLVFGERNLEPDVPPALLAQQSIPSKTRKPGESAIYRSPLASHGQPLVHYDERFKNVKTIYDAFLSGLDRAGSLKNCFGTRQDHSPYVWETYGEVHERILNFGSGLLECGLKPKSDQNFVGIYAKNCPEWLIAEVACGAYSLVVVPLYDTLGHDAISYIINQTGMSTVICAEDKLGNLFSVAKQCKSLQYVVKIGSLTNDEKQKARDANLTLLYFKGVEALGKESRKAPVPSDTNDLITICYTSGTTGDPKGVMLTHQNVVADASAILRSLPENLTLNEDDVHLSFLPLAHIFEQLIACGMLALGASIAFYRGEVLKLLEDVAEARPTIFPAVPRLLNRVHDKIWQTINEAPVHRQFLFKYALQKKKNMLRQGVLRNDTFWDRLVFRKIQARLGGRVRLMVTGAAPISAEVLDFFRAAMGCQVLEGYGQTETSAVITVTQVGDYSIDAGGHVGAVVPCCEVKLVDIPEMDYFATDQPNPRGEICVRGYNIFKGYYKLPDKTKEALDNDGWCHTGDVGTFLPNGTLKIIDRKKNIFKLSQGEYIAPEKIENVYVQSQWVAQAFVHGESIRSTLVGVIIPDHEVLMPWARSQGIPGSIADICKNQDVQKMIFEDIVRLGKEMKLHSFEQVKMIHLDSRLFAVENGLLTPTFKSRRDALKKYYSKEIDKMYRAVEG